MKASCFFVLIPILANGAALAAPPAKNPAREKADRRFAVACKKGFDPAESGEFGEELCECTARKSHSQNVPLKALEAETRKIEASTSYKIQDKRLLAALQECTGDLAHGMTEDRLGHGHRDEGN